MSDPTANNEETKVTVGLDLGDRHIQVCVVDEAGEVIEEARLATRPQALRRRFCGADQLRIVLEAGTHSPWVSRLLAELGHEVLVANPRKLRLIYANDSKSDRVDAEYLARVGRLAPALLAPLRHRGAETQVDLALLRSRNALVRARTRLISHARGTTKSLGARLPACSSASFAAKAGACLPDELRPALAPVLAVIAGLGAQINALDERIAEMVRQRYPLFGPTEPGSSWGPHGTPWEAGLLIPSARRGAAVVESRELGLCEPSVGVVCRRRAAAVGACARRSR